MSGKGSKPRPFSVTQQEYDTRWDAIFQRDLKEEKIIEEAPVLENNQSKESDKVSSSGGTINI
jgi:hypothetical protein